MSVFGVAGKEPPPPAKFDDDHWEAGAFVT